LGSSSLSSQPSGQIQKGGLFLPVGQEAHSFALRQVAHFIGHSAHTLV